MTVSSLVNIVTVLSFNYQFNDLLMKSIVRLYLPVISDLNIIWLVDCFDL